jgi:hypothetical protein
MFQKLGLRHYAYLDMGQEPKELQKFRPYVDREVEAMKRHSVDLLAWFYWIDSDDPAEDPKIKITLESFRHHGVRPHLWISQSNASVPKTSEEWAKYFPQDVKIPKTTAEFEKLSESEKQRIEEASLEADARFYREDAPKTPKEYKARVQREAERIRALVNLAKPYGCPVDIYNHGGWFGMTDNQLAIIKRLEEMGVSGVGIVYNFSHARDRYHDDSKNFEPLWRRMQSQVVTVNITAMKMDTGIVDYPSQGDSELEMMRIIQASGWRGPAGVVVQRPEDAEKVLAKDLLGLDWLAAELKKPGSGGPRPFPVISHAH